MLSLTLSLGGGQESSYLDAWFGGNLSLGQSIQECLKEVGLRVRRMNNWSWIKDRHFICLSSHVYWESLSTQDLAVNRIDIVPCPCEADGLVGDKVSPERSMGFSERREMKASMSSKGDEGGGSGKCLQCLWGMEKTPSPRWGRAQTIIGWSKEH